MFWKLGLDAQARYIFESENFQTNSYISQLPTQGLNDPSVITALPSKSWDIYGFLGVRNIAFGLGFGYQYTMKILNYGDETGEEINRSKGYVLVWSFN